MVQVTVNEREQTLIVHTGSAPYSEAYANGYLDGELFYIFVLAAQCRQGIAKQLVTAFRNEVESRGATFTTTRPTSSEGAHLINWIETNKGNTDHA